MKFEEVKEKMESLIANESLAKAEYERAKNERIKTAREYAIELNKEYLDYIGKRVKITCPSGCRNEKEKVYDGYFVDISYVSRYGHSMNDADFIMKLARVKKDGTRSLNEYMPYDCPKLAEIISIELV